MKAIQWFPLALLGCCAVAQAQLQVIADKGGESAVRFYEPIQPVHSEDAPKHPDAVPGEIKEEQLLPVVSHKWSVGVVQPRHFQLPGALPLFLIGADETSYQWLTKHRDTLMTLNATGMMINVATLDEITKAREIVPTLSILPVPADTLADRLGIHHYPLLLTESGISQ